MAGTALLGRLTWQLADVVDVVEETPRVKTIVLDVSDWAGHRAGQHVDIRLTAEDGYQAERSYSIASAPDGTRIELTVERLDDGEVSPYLTDELRPGDRIELRGPIGGYFIWEASQDGPVLLAAGGFGRRTADGDGPCAGRRRQPRRHAARSLLAQLSTSAARRRSSRPWRRHSSSSGTIRAASRRNGSDQREAEMDPH